MHPFFFWSTSIFLRSKEAGQEINGWTSFAIVRKKKKIKENDYLANCHPFRPQVRETRDEGGGERWRRCFVDQFIQILAVTGSFMYLKNHWQKTNTLLIDKSHGCPRPSLPIIQPFHSVYPIHPLCSLEWPQVYLDPRKCYNCGSPTPRLPLSSRPFLLPSPLPSSRTDFPSILLVPHIPCPPVPCPPVTPKSPHFCHWTQYGTDSELRPRRAMDLDRGIWAHRTI